MNRLSLSTLLSVALASAAASPAVAQTAAPATSSDRVLVTLGLSVLHENYGAGRGGELEVLSASAKRIGSMQMRIVLDAGMNLFDGFSEVTLMAGVRLGGQRRTVVRPFGQILAGFEHCHLCKSTDPAFEPAGGVDIAIGRRQRLSVRAGLGARITLADRRTFKETHVFIGLSLPVGAARVER